jgi:tetratricopeptide (TPR) repeat protein
MRSRTLLLFLLALAWLGTSALAQQRSRMRGTVVDSDGNPVAEAEVTVENPVSMPAMRKKTTNDKGRFVFNGVQVGDWKITVRADGFHPSVQNFHVGVGENLQMELVLDRAEGTALLATSGKAQEEIAEARKRFHAGDYDGAIALFHELLKKAPDVHQIHFNLALAYERKGDYAAAVDDLRKFLEEEPDHFEANQSMANALSRTGQKKESLPYYQKCTELRPQDAIAFFNLGLAYFEGEQIDESAAAFEQSLVLDPNLADSYYMLGGLHLRRQDADGARQAYEKFLEMAPDSPNAGAAREALKRLSQS